jgi:hypothetical protein
MTLPHDHESILKLGPQDGAKIRSGSGVYPPVLYVGPKWLGDGFAAWSRKGSKRFPARYRLVSNEHPGGFVYKFDGYAIPSPQEPRP